MEKRTKHQSIFCKPVHSTRTTKKSDPTLQTSPPPYVNGDQPSTFTGLRGSYETSNAQPVERGEKAIEKNNYIYSFFKSGNTRKNSLMRQYFLSNFVNKNETKRTAYIHFTGTPAHIGVLLKYPSKDEPRSLRGS